MPTPLEATEDLIAQHQRKHSARAAVIAVVSFEGEVLSSEIWALKERLDKFWSTVNAEGRSGGVDVSKRLEDVEKLQFHMQAVRRLLDHATSLLNEAQAHRVERTLEKT